MKLGISSYTYAWAVGVPGHEPARPLDELGLLDRAREHGVALLQIADNLPVHTFDAARLERLGERASGAGIELEVGTRGLTVEQIERYCEIARRLGAKLVRVVIDEPGHHPPPERVAAFLRECVPVLEGRGAAPPLTLGVENHDRFPAAALRGMIEAAGSERIGVCLDTANSLGAGEGIQAVVSVLAPLVVNLHVKDFHIARLEHLMGFTVTGRPAGAGMLDVPWLLARLEAAPRCRTAVLELWTPPEPRLEETIAKEARWAKQSLEFLGPLFAPR